MKLITLEKPLNRIPLKKPEIQGAKFSRNETYLSYVAKTGKLKQRRRLGFFREFFITEVDSNHNLAPG